MLTLKQIAAKIAPLDGREAADVHSKLRNPQIYRLLTPAHAGPGRTSAAYYAENELIRARIIVALLDLNFLSAEVEEVSLALDYRTEPGFVGEVIKNPPSAEVLGGKGYHYRTGLDSIIRGALAGEDWRIRVTITRSESGERKIRAHVAWHAWQESIRASRASASARHETLMGKMEIYASGLIAPLLPPMKG
ncbi:hypothetical protein ACIPCF_02120 [Paracoccus marcusii]|uniref:hypothetical protein n=1 Tax=Paracoccus marcusii TaxID=59779 RepID=UPI0038BC6C27